MKPYITAYLSEDTKPIIMKDLAKLRESALTEEDLAAETQQEFLKRVGQRWNELDYPQAKAKEKIIMRGSKVNERDTFSDKVCGVLNPIVHALNKGKAITPNSLEHRILKDLLQKANS